MNSQPKPALTLHRGWDDPGYVWSPFVTKVEFRLRTSSARYTNGSGSPFSAPRGKIPYMEVAYPGQPVEHLADSTLIARALSARGVVPDINTTLSPSQKAQDLAICALLEDRLYFLLAQERWVKNYFTQRDHVLSSIPYPLRIFVGILAYRGNVKKLHDQGVGRFSDAEIQEFVNEIWEGIAALLRESRDKAQRGECFWVLGGEQPTEADASLFGFITSVLVSDANPWTQKLVKTEFSVVVEYAERIHNRWFPDYEMWCR